jgi:hypothetical protein
MPSMERSADESTAVEATGETSGPTVIMFALIAESRVCEATPPNADDTTPNIAKPTPKRAFSDITRPPISHLAKAAGTSDFPSDDSQPKSILNLHSQTTQEALTALPE